MGTGSFAKYFEDQPRSVDDFGLPASFQIALLDWRQGAVDHNQVDRMVLDRLTKLVNGTAAKQGGGTRPQNARYPGSDDIQSNGASKPYRLLEPRFCRARCFVTEMSVQQFGCRMQNQGASGCPAIRQSAVVFFDAQSSSLSLPGSNSWIGWAGITVEIACL